MSTIPPSPTGRRVLRSLALHQLGRHMAYPDIHAATFASLTAAGYVTGLHDHDHHEARLTAAGWVAVGLIVEAEAAS